jgi:hypothetical protein
MAEPFCYRFRPAILYQIKEETMSAGKKFNTEEAKRIGDKLGIDWSQVNLDEFRVGLGVELEHGLHDPETNVTNNDELLTGKIALAHLKEFPDYYTRLEKLEAEAEEYWSKKK